MAITQAICTSFKSELLGGIHDLDTDTLKFALYPSTATLSAATTAYSSTGECTGAGYSAGGVAVVTPLITPGATSFLDFNDISFTTITTVCRGGVLYNSSKSNKAIAVFDFGSNITLVGQTLTLVAPAPGTTTAVLRIS